MKRWAGGRFNQTFTQDAKMHTFTLIKTEEQPGCEKEERDRGENTVRRERERREKETTEAEIPGGELRTAHIIINTEIIKKARHVFTIFVFECSFLPCVL